MFIAQPHDQGFHVSAGSGVRMTLRNFLRAVVLLLLPLLAFADADGPYVLRNGADTFEAWLVEATPNGERRAVKPVKSGAVITVPAVGAVPAFSFKLRAEAAAAPDSIRTRRNTPLLVVADTHGEYEILVQMLRAQRVVNERLEWRFGRGHLVVLGDVFDRGAHQVEILWLIYALEAQAQKAGGGVHFVLGNHEVMALRGDARYLNPKYRQTTLALGVDSYAELFGASSVLGQWLRSKATVIRINDLLCLHGGISPQIVARNLSAADINTGVRLSWREHDPERGSQRELVEFLLGAEGPLWYRGYFPDADARTAVSVNELDRMLAHFGVRKILIGHTRVPTITPLFEGRVLAVQVYPQRVATGAVTFEALLVSGGNFLRALPDGRTEFITR